MPIPSFDAVLNILPPHLGNPTRSSDLSPYPCTVAELCRHFATTVKRKQILEGFFNFRAELFAAKIRGFQWLGGSFMENIEMREGRDPNDLDAITFVADPATPEELTAKLGSNPELLDHARLKGVFFVDHYWVSLGSSPVYLIDLARYWYGVFSHRRDRVWKGMLAVHLIDKSEDDAARMFLGSQP